MRDADDTAKRRYLESTGRRRFVRFWREFVRRRPLGTAGAVLIILMLLTAAFADRIAPYDPVEIRFSDLLQGPSFQHLLGTDPFGRDVRSSALSIVNMPYIEATRAVGSGAVRIMFRHIAPNVFAPYLIMLTAFLGQAILLEASLSFLGLGVFEPTPSWGLMLRGAGMQFLEQAPWLAIAPGVAISLAVFGFNLFGDSLRDALDPRLRTA